MHSFDKLRLVKSSEIQPLDRQRRTARQPRNANTRQGDFDDDLTEEPLFGDLLIPDRGPIAASAVRGPAKPWR